VVLADVRRSIGSVPNPRSNVLLDLLLRLGNARYYGDHRRKNIK
jgi:hypothetical protein